MSEVVTANPPATEEHADNIRKSDQPSAVAPEDFTVRPVAESLAERQLHPLRSSEVVFGVVTIFLWLCFFLAGIVVETRSVRHAVSSSGKLTPSEMLGIWFILLTSYTVTNIAILACLAGVIGKFSRRSLSYEVASLSQLRAAPIATFREVSVLYSVAIARGFVIYLLMIGGLILLTTPVVTDSSPEEYIKVAGTVSILAFMAGYDAEIFKRALDRISTFSSDPKTKA